MPFRFVHTADVHLDSPLRTLALKNQELAELVANATRATFVRIVDLCIEERVDALIIAGDLYDGELTSMKTAIFFASEMQRLVDASIQAFILRGNHDAESKITRHIELPEGVEVFSSRGKPIALKKQGVVLHGLSFAKPHVPESLLSKYKAAVPDCINIGVLHTSLAGSAEHDPYSPCSVAELMAQGYTYWALGHIHKREVHQNPSTTIVMPGIPQGRHINESGPKSITLVDIEDNQSVRIEERVLCSVQFERVRVDLSGCDDWGELGEQLAEAFADAHERLQTEHLVVRLSLEGHTEIAGQLRRDKEALEFEAESRAKAVGSIWVEQIDVSAQPPSSDAGLAADLSGPLAELRTLVEKTLETDTHIDEDALSQLNDLMRALPAELRERFDGERPEVREALRAQARTGAAEVLARLESVGEGN